MSVDPADLEPELRTRVEWVIVMGNGALKISYTWRDKEEQDRFWAEYQTFRKHGTPWAATGMTARSASSFRL